MKNRICNGLPQASNLVVSMKSENGEKPVALLLVCSADLREAIDSGICQIYYRLLRVQYTMHRIQRLQILSFVSFCSCRLSLLLASKILVFQFFLIGEYDRQDVFFAETATRRLLYEWNENFFQIIFLVCESRVVHSWTGGKLQSWKLHYFMIPACSYTGKSSVIKRDDLHVDAQFYRIPQIWSLLYALPRHFFAISPFHSVISSSNAEWTSRR